MRMSRLSMAGLLFAGVATLAAGCSGGGGAATGTPVSATAPGTPAVSDGSTSGPLATSPAASQQPAAGGGSGTLPSDPCQLVSATDVSAIYGGQVKSLGLDDNGSCAFEIEGKAKAGTSAAAGEFAVKFEDEWSSYEDVKAVFGDAATTIDGLGTEAYSIMGFIHAKVGAGGLVVGGVWIGNYDRAALDQEAFDMTKLLLGRL